MAVVATGFFDGVHLGHRQVIQTLVSSARQKGEEAIVVTFAQHPRAVLQQDARDLRLLNSPQEKEALLRALGVDRVEVLPFDRAFARLTAEQYIRTVLQERLGATRLVLGYDNRLGSDRLTPDLIAPLAQSLGLEVVIVPAAVAGVVESAAASPDRSHPRLRKREGPAAEGCGRGPATPDVRRGWLPRSGVAERNRICFPNRLEAIEVLSAADPGDARAAWLLGNLWYDKRQYDQAERCWEQAVAADPDFPGAWRCLALVRYNKRHDAAGALAAMERAYALDETDARILMELDQLHRKLGSPAQERLDRLQAHRAQVESRDDLVLEEITLLNDLGRYQEARTKLDAHRFHPWEGGEGKVPAQYQRCRVELAKQAMAEERWADAVALLEECLVYPEHLGEGKLYGAQEQDFYYYLGCVWQGAGQPDKARACWEKGAQGDLKPVPALYYNDAKPEKIYYQGLALAALGRTAEAEAKFRMLQDYGEAHRGDEVVMDYFAVSLPDLAVWDEDLTRRNVAHCDLMARLGREGLAVCGVSVE